MANPNTNAKTQALEWVVRQSGGKLGPEEQAAFSSWLRAHPTHRGAYLRARAIEHALESVTPDEDLRPSLDSVRDGLDARGFRTLQRGRRTFLLSGLAAAGVAGLALPFLLPSTDRIVLRTARGELRKVPLADRSTISMNGASRIAVKLGKHDRRIRLTQGEAWFEVAKDRTRPFIVEAGGVSVRAVGTAFAVRRRDDGTDVVVTEGVVEVWNAHGAAGKVRMAAGELAQVDERASGIAVARDPGEAARRLAWRDGMVVLRAQTLADAVAEFNRYNTRTLVIRDPRLAGLKLVGQYHVGDLERFAEDLHVLFGVPVVLKAETIEIGR
jgi:transmembrane sensor